MHIRLLRAIRGLIALNPLLARWLDESEGPNLVIEGFDSEPWASLTFSGRRHRLELRLQGIRGDVMAAAEALRALLRQPDLALPGHFLAEIEVAESIAEIHRDDHMRLAIQVEALTIEE